MNRILIFLYITVSLNKVFGQNMLEEAFLLTSKHRYDPDVKAFYEKYSPDTSKSYMHNFTHTPGIGIYLNPYDQYQTILQVGVSNEYKGLFPFGLKIGMSEAEVLKFVGPAIASKPNISSALDRIVVLKGGIAFSISFVGGKLESVSTLVSGKEFNDVTLWKMQPFEKYKEGCMTGDCKNSPSVLSVNKDVYLGSMKNGIQEGYGQFYYSDRSFFQGLYHNGKRKNGVYFFNSGNSFSGEFDSEGKIMKGKFTYVNETTFDGSYINNKPYNGILKYKNGNTFTGILDESGKFVSGKYFRMNEGTFEGTFIGDNKPYNGTFTNLSGVSRKIQNGEVVK